MGREEHLRAWWAAMDDAARDEWLGLGGAGAGDVAPPELGPSLRAAVPGEQVEAAGFRGWLVPADVWRFLEGRRTGSP